MIDYSIIRWLTFFIDDPLNPGTEREVVRQPDWLKWQIESGLDGTVMGPFTKGESIAHIGTYLELIETYCRIKQWKLLRVDPSALTEQQAARYRADLARVAARTESLAQQSLDSAVL